jgi:hypothetical protein
MPEIAVKSVKLGALLDAVQTEGRRLREAGKMASSKSGGESKLSKWTFPQIDHAHPFMTSLVHLRKLLRLLVLPEHRGVLLPGVGFAPRGGFGLAVLER